jgi:hypothetical protein
VSQKTGIRCKLYVDLSVGGDGSDLQELKAINDWTQNFDWEKASFTTRGTGYEVSVKTGVKFGWSGKLVHSPGDDAYDKVIDMLHSREGSVIVLGLTGPKTVAGNSGYQCLCQVVKGNQDQGVGVALMDDVEFVPYPPDDAVAATLLRRATTGGSPVTVSYSTLPA